MIGLPADPMKVWEARNGNKAAAALYQELAAELGSEVMTSERSVRGATPCGATTTARLPPQC